MFPAPDEAASEINAAEIEHNLTVRDLAHMVRDDVARFSDVESLAIAAYDGEGAVADDEAAQVAERLTRIRNAIADVLWPQELFVAPEVIDELLFQAVKEASDDPTLAVLTRLRDARVDEGGLLVFGVHSIGMQAADLSQLLARRGVELIEPDWGLAVSPQTNDLGKTIDFLRRVAEQFGVESRVPTELIAHWRRSRQAAWLDRNPLVVVRVAEASGSYFGNEALLLTRLQAATVLVAMLASLQPGADPGHRASLTTRMINNLETLDVHHYMVLSPGRGSAKETAELAGAFVPIARTPSELIDMSTLRMDLDPGYWRDNTADAEAVAGAVTKVYRDYLRRGFDRSQDDAVARASRRRFMSTTFFQRSFTGLPWRDVITLATAFELLYEPGGNTTKRIRNKLRAIVAGSEARTLVDAFDQVTTARNEIMHHGTQRTEVDLPRAREIYVRAFVSAAT